MTASRPAWPARLSSGLATARTRQHYRQRTVAADEGGLVNFCANDYLGLSGHPRVIEAFRRGGGRRVGSGAAALISGYRAAHRELEQALAAFLQRDAVLLFGSGYLANLALASGLMQRGDVVVQDRLCHASLIDAARLADGRLLRYPHGDAAACARQLERYPEAPALVMTDGLFSMDGTLAPVTELAAVCKDSGAWLVVDDAHGIGVLGEHGRGSLELAGLDQNQVPVLVGTLGKAFGAAGAFIAGSHELIEHLVQRARSYIYTTAPPPALAAAATAALEVIRDEPEHRQALMENIRYFRQQAQARNLAISDVSGPIQPLMAGDAGRALAMSEALRRQGYWVSAIRPPTVAAGTERLRITLSAVHTREQIDGLLAALEPLQERLMEQGDE